MKFLLEHLLTPQAIRKRKAAAKRGRRATGMLHCPHCLAVGKGRTFDLAHFDNCAELKVEMHFW